VSREYCLPCAPLRSQYCIVMKELGRGGESRMSVHKNVEPLSDHPLFRALVLMGGGLAVGCGGIARGDAPPDASVGGSGLIVGAEHTASSGRHVVRESPGRDRRGFHGVRRVRTVIPGVTMSSLDTGASAPGRTPTVG